MVDEFTLNIQHGTPPTPHPKPKANPPETVNNGPPQQSIFDPFALDGCLIVVLKPYLYLN